MADVVMWSRLAVFFQLSLTRHLTVPSNARHGKGNAILRKENKEQPEPIKLPRGGSENCYHSVPHAVMDNRFATTLVPFSFFFAVPMADKYT